MLILPAIDVLGGKCVRLAQGDYGRVKVYDSDPVRMAARFEEQGAEWLHLVDLDGAKSGTPANLDVVALIARATKLRIEFSGGLRSRDLVLEALDLGATRVVIGSKLARDPDLSRTLFEELGERVAGGIDARDGRAATEGWTESTEHIATDLARRAEAMGCKRLIVTDIARDGMLTGPNLELLQEIRRSVTVPIIQSGGISGLEDLRILAGLGNEAPEGVIVGRAIYEGNLDLAAALAIMGP